MEIILRIFQVFLAIGLIGVVLLQRSEGGGLGVGSSGGMGSFMSVRGTANFMTRVTGILAALFMLTCLVMAVIAKPSQKPQSIFDTPSPAAPVQTLAPVPVAPPAADAVVPLAPATSAPTAPPIAQPEAAVPAAPVQPQSAAPAPATPNAETPAKAAPVAAPKSSGAKPHKQ
jgi:preprotein translocase subunit SecG